MKPKQLVIKEMKTNKISLQFDDVGCRIWSKNNEVDFILRERYGSKKFMDVVKILLSPSEFYYFIGDSRRTFTVSLTKIGKAREFISYNN